MSNLYILWLKLVLFLSKFPAHTQKKKFRADQCPLMVVFYMTLHSILRVGRKYFHKNLGFHAES